MKNNLLALLFISVTILGACQYDGQGPKAGVVPYDGPSDGGGGDTCNGKMIESFRVDISKLEEYRAYVQPILDKTMEGHQEEGKGGGSPILLSLTLKNWYIIDCKLQDIPKERKGLYVETYQTAIHTSGEVFIDSTSYEKMALEEKGKLLLHEMVMGAYLLKYLTLEEICKKTNCNSPDIATYSKWKMFRPEAYRPLNDQDHQKIRAVTAWLWSQGNSINPKTLQNFLQAHDFDMRFNQTSQNDAKEIEVKVESLVRMIKKHQWSKNFPEFCQFDSVQNVSQAHCDSQITAEVKPFSSNADIKALYLRVKITRQSDHKILEQDFVFPLAKKIKLSTIKIGSLRSIGIFSLFGNWPSFSSTKPEEGSKSQMLMLMLDTVNPEDLNLLQINYLSYVWYSFEEEISVRDGLRMKYLYGYPSLLNDDSETIFTEAELSFNFNPHFLGRTFLRAEPVVD